MAREKFRDPRGAHLRIYCSMLDSPAWFALNYSQRALYIACRRKLTSNNNGNLAFTLAGLKDQGFVASPSTLAGGLRALRSVGFIAVTREGGQVRRGQAIATLYRFTDEDCHEWRKLDIPMIRASNDWRRFQTVEAASAAIDAEEHASQMRHKAREERKAAQAALVSPTVSQKSPIRKSARDDTKSGVEPVRKVEPNAISDAENRIVNELDEAAEIPVE